MKKYFVFNISMKSYEATRFLLLLSFLISNTSYSQTTKTLTSSGILEVPAGVTSLSVQCWGAGGGGGGSNLLTAAGGGGGGGAFKQGTVTVGADKDNVKVSYTVGAGGTGGSSSNINGSAGGVSIFSTISANGGAGGQGGTSLVAYGPGGAGGAAGDYKGGDGASGDSILVVGLFSGGGGSSAGTSANGNPASGRNGGTAQTGGGAGGSGALLLGNGSNGASPGGGGGGGAGLLSPLSATATGGNGGNGQIKATYTCPVYSVTSITADTNCEQTSIITLHSTSVGLPVGTYTVTYTIGGSPVPQPPVTMVVETAGTGTIEFADLPIAGIITINVTHLTSVDCSSPVNASITFDRPSVPIVGTITHPTCVVPSGSVELSGLPGTGTWTISPGDYTGTGTTTTISGLASGTHNFVVYKGVCSSQTVSASFAVVVNNPPPTRTWNGAWDVVPTIENKVVFAANYNEDADVEACSCEVNSGAHVNFKTGRYLKIRNELTVNAAGSLTFENDASLVQISGDAVNSGDIIYKRHTKPVKRYDYTYWSSPVERQTLKNLSPYTLVDKYYSYDATSPSGWVLHYDGNKIMLPGEGYIVRAPQTFSITSAAIDSNPVFVGKPNNGEIKKQLSGNLVYLLGNPYPSALDADAFLTVNASKLGGTLYFWTHNTPIQLASNITNGTAGSGLYAYTSDDYAIYNATGGVGTAAVTGGSTPIGNIAAAQGFFAPASADGGEVVFNNEMRLSSNTVMDNSQFFKLGKTAKSAAVVKKNRLWLNLTNAQGAFKQTLIGYITGATDEYEGRFDGLSYDGNAFVDFYSVNQGFNLAIQGRALPFQQKDTVVLGYKSAIAGEFKISIDHTDGVLSSQDIVIEDKVMKVFHNLKKGAYIFTTEKGVFNNRFVLKYQDKEAEIVEETVDSSVVVSANNKKIRIVVDEAEIKEVCVYDFSGNLVYSKEKIDKADILIDNLPVTHKALIVKVLLANGKKTVKKIIY